MFASNSRRGRAVARNQTEQEYIYNIIEVYNTYFKLLYSIKLMDWVRARAGSGRWWCGVRAASGRSRRRTGCGGRSARCTTWRASRATRASGSSRPASASAFSAAACSAPSTTPTCSSYSIAPTPPVPPVRLPSPLTGLPSAPTVELRYIRLASDYDSFDSHSTFDALLCSSLEVPLREEKAKVNERKGKEESLITVCEECTVQ